DISKYWRASVKWMSLGLIRCFPIRCYQRFRALWLLKQFSHSDKLSPSFNFPKAQFSFPSKFLARSPLASFQLYDIDYLFLPRDSIVNILNCPVPLIKLLLPIWKSIVYECPECAQRQRYSPKHYRLGVHWIPHLNKMNPTSLTTQQPPVYNVS